MTGFATVKKIRRIEETLHNLGMQLYYDKYASTSDEHSLSVIPRDDELPMYSRDATLFTGSLEALDYWLMGVQWSRGYDLLLRVSDDKKRARKEQDTRNKHTMQRIKNEEVDLVKAG